MIPLGILKKRLMKKFFSFILLLSFSLALAAQEKNISFQFRSILFSDLADTIENTVPVKIYYSDKWVDSLYLDINASEESVAKLFDKSISTKGFSFIITDHNQIILSKGFPIKTNFNKEYREQLRRKIIMADTLKYIQQLPDDGQNSINDEYKIFRIGNPSALKRSQTAFLSGTVRNSTNDEPVAGAIIYIDKLKAGVLTNEDGFYQVELPKGELQIEYRMVGMRTAKRNITIFSDGSLDVDLFQSTNQLDEVTVSASRENNVRNVTMGIEKISVKMLKQLPMGLGETDLIKSSLLLPGVQSASEASNGFNIRGGSIDQNLILFNGAPIINVSHFFGFFSAFNSDIIKDVTLYKSGIPAKFGGRVSSVMDIAINDGNKEKVNISGGVSPVTARLMVEGPVIKNKSSFILSGRTTYSDWILGMLDNVQLNNSSASFNDFQGQLSFNLNQNNTLSVSGYLSNDMFDYYLENKINYSNLASTVKLKHTFGPKFSMQLAGIISNYNYELDSKRNATLYNSLTYKLNQRLLRADFTYFPIAKHKIEFGLDATNYSLLPGTQKPIGEASETEFKSLKKENAIEPSIYFSDEYEYSARLLLSGGLRFTMFTSIGPGTKFLYAQGGPLSTDYITDTITYKNGQIIQTYPGLEFRFSSRFILAPDLSLKAGIQRNFQYLNMISNTTSMSPTDIWKLSDSYIKPQRGDQYSLGIYKNLRRSAAEASVEVYYKSLNNIIDYKGGAVLLMNEHLETDILNGTGKAYGLEIMLKKQAGKLTGWIGYTYSRSFLKVDGKYDEEKINDGKYFPASFDKPHDLKVIANAKLSRRINFTTNFMYSTGRPITYPVTYYEFNNVVRVFYSERNEFRVPDYMRLDLSATMNGNLKSNKLNHSSFTFTVYNVLGRRNPYSIFFKVENGTVKGYQMSIFGQPIFMVTYNFRIRGNASSDF
jgi:hypothetical protein